MSWGNSNLVRTVAPTAEPVTREEVKEHLRVTHTAEDVLISRYIEAAREHIEKTYGAQFMTATWVLYLDEFADEMILPKSPLASVTSIQYVDTAGATQTLGNATYQVSTDLEPGRIWLAYNQSWPTIRSQRETITITYTAGWSSAANVPRLWKMGLYQLIAHWYASREPIISGTIVTEVPLTLRNILSSIWHGYEAEMLA